MSYKPIRIIATKKGRICGTYESMSEARNAYGISGDRLMRLIIEGEPLGDVCFDFAEGTDTARAEDLWQRRRKYELERKKEYRARKKEGT